MNKIGTAFLDAHKFLLQKGLTNFSVGANFLDITFEHQIQGYIFISIYEHRNNPEHCCISAVWDTGDEDGCYRPIIKNVVNFFNGCPVGVPFANGTEQLVPLSDLKQAIEFVLEPVSYEYRDSEIFAIR